ncbi:hypothetical protein EDB85DRAFT_1895098 [Lactarius pseudohatsudake]|nr:hypothetical protein EDB85DRAFT_1895098 [Lactarius pseudohatsudake]
MGPPAHLPLRDTRLPRVCAFCERGPLVWERRKGGACVQLTLGPEPDIAKVMRRATRREVQRGVDKLWDCTALGLYSGLGTDRRDHVLAAFVQNEGKTAVHKSAVTGHRSPPAPTLVNHFFPLTGIARDFKAAVIRLLERFLQGTCKHTSWTRLAHLVEESEPHKAAALIDAIISAVGAEHAEKLVLSTESPSLRFQHVTNVLSRNNSPSKSAPRLLRLSASLSLSRQQRALFLRQQLAAINAELQRLEPGNTDLHGTGNGVEDEDELDNTLPAGSEVRRAATAEARRLKWIPPQNAEHGVVRTLVPWTPPATASETLTRSDFLTNSKSQLDRTIMDWKSTSPSSGCAQEAETEQAKTQEVTLKNIDDPTAGAHKANNRKRMRAGPLSKQANSWPYHKYLFRYPRKACQGPRALRPPFYCQSIARALGWPSQRIALGGARDEAKIRGHRRTYVASGPGLLARPGPCARPVVWIRFYYFRRFDDNDDDRDEIDKVGQSNYHGDPSVALLEVLDPEQNVAFNAHDEKLHIARRFLLPKQLAQNGLSGAHVQPAEPASLQTVTPHTREAGLRSLERSIGGIAQFKAIEPATFIVANSVANSLGTMLGQAYQGQQRGYNPVFEADELEKILGLSRCDGEDCEREARQGVVWNLVVTGMGEGEIMPVESIATPGAGGPPSPSSCLGFLFAGGAYAGEGKGDCILRARVESQGRVEGDDIVGTALKAAASSRMNTEFGTPRSQAADHAYVVRALRGPSEFEGGACPTSRGREGEDDDSDSSTSKQTVWSAFDWARLELGSQVNLKGYKR